MWDSEPWLQLHLLALRKNGLHNKRTSELVMVHYSLNFTAYKTTSGGVFLRCGTLSLGYNCTSWPCAKMVSTKGIYVYFTIIKYNTIHSIFLTLGVGVRFQIHHFYLFVFSIQLFVHYYC